METTADDPLPHEYWYSVEDYRVPGQSIMSLLKSFCLSIKKTDAAAQEIANYLLDRKYFQKWT